MPRTGGKNKACRVERTQSVIFHVATGKFGGTPMFNVIPPEIDSFFACTTTACGRPKIKFSARKLNFIFVNPEGIGQRHCDTEIKGQDT